MVMVHKTIGTSYIVAELDGSQSQLRVAGFCLIPYFPQTRSSFVIPPDDSDDDQDNTEDDPEDVHYLTSLDAPNRSYVSLDFPSL